MLTDIFAYRYNDIPMWDAVEKRDMRFIVQAYRIVQEQLFPPHTDGKSNDWAEERWKVIHDRLSSELGVLELSKRVVGYYAEYAGKRSWTSYTKPWHQVCEDFLTKDCESNESPDEYLKARLSLIEIAFRERGENVASRNRELPGTIRDWTKRLARKGAVKPEDTAWIAEANRKLNDDFKASVDELNTRLRRARYGLNYHNGYIQISKDEMVEQEIETPFWALLADLKWKNVETDMAEAIDLRDTGGRDPAWYAAKALESTIKIISDDKGFSRGSEKGAANYIDNLRSKNNGQFIDGWESESMKQFFKHVRNPFGHGAGSAEMPKLINQQTNWAIEFCMTWIKSLIERI